EPGLLLHPSKCPAASYSARAFRCGIVCRGLRLGLQRHSLEVRGTICIDMRAAGPVIISKLRVCTNSFLSSSPESVIKKAWYAVLRRNLFSSLSKRLSVNLIEQPWPSLLFCP